MSLKTFIGLVVTGLTTISMAANSSYLVKVKNGEQGAENFLNAHGGKLELVNKATDLYQWSTAERVEVKNFRDANITYIQKNNPIHLLQNPSLEAKREALKKAYDQGLIRDTKRATDNPEIQNPGTQASGADPLLKDAWGMFKIGADQAWKKAQGQGIVVAVTDTGVDYNHPDLIANMWRNKGEIAGDNIDNDNNGYVDDIVGWDFFSNDNKPYDLALSITEILFSGGNPGHGTHCSGVVAAKLGNGQGTSGVAPQAKIMGLRFLSEKGQGDTAGAVKAIDYAVANGANIISASWGSEGEEEGDVVLREAIQRAEAKGVLFIAAAGNGRVDQSAGKAFGYNNDTDAKPSYPATYPYKNIISVAAIDKDDKLAEFSNYGPKPVHVGAPGVKILSTVPEGKYQDTIIEMGGLMTVTWDGTSMATPFVSGSAAVIWSQDPSMSSEAVKEKLLGNTTSISSLTGKTVTEGRVDLTKAVN